MPLPVPPHLYAKPQPADAKWPTPPYAIPTSFTEFSTSLDGPQVPAILALPKSASSTAKVPAVILIAGSGPIDVDGTYGGIKFLRDLAWGLASNGIAVLRWGKNLEIREESWFTPRIEYTEPMTRAREWISQQGEIDQEKVYLLGHSLGGKVLPMVKEEIEKTSPGPKGQIAGAVFMAPGYSPLQWSCVRQLRYVDSLPRPGFVKVDGITMGEWVAAAKRVDAAVEDEGWFAQNLPLALSAKWWREDSLLRPIDRIQKSFADGFPMLLLQGDVDFNVTVEEDYRFWREGLEKRKGVEFALLKGIEHFFTQVHGWATPRDVDQMCHIDGKVIGTITEWMFERRRDGSGKVMAKV